MSKIGYFFIFVFVFILIGCSPTDILVNVAVDVIEDTPDLIRGLQLPKSNHPAQIERVFEAPFDQVWSAVLKIMKTSEGTVITEDTPAGLIVYSMLDEGMKATQIHMQVYVKRLSQLNTIAVYLVADIVWATFEHQPSYNSRLKELAETAFFEKLAKSLEEG